MGNGLMAVLPSFFRSFLFLLLLFGVGNIHSSAQTANQVLIKIVDQFDETVGQGSAGPAADNSNSTLAHLFPSGPQRIERGTDAENFGIYNTYDSAPRTEYWSSREAFTNRALKNESIEWLGAKIGIEVLWLFQIQYPPTSSRGQHLGRME